MVELCLTIYHPFQTTKIGSIVDLFHVIIQLVQHPINFCHFLIEFSELATAGGREGEGRRWQALAR